MEDVCQSWTCEPTFNIARIIEIAKQKKVDAIVVGNEVAIFRGITDEAKRCGIPCYAPTVAASQLEFDKVFAKQLASEIMPEIIAPFLLARNLFDVENFIQEHGLPVVLKQPTSKHSFEITRSNNRNAILEISKQTIKTYGWLLIEKYLDGAEFALYCFTDGSHHFFPKVVRDYPFKLPGNRGIKTGGMGSISFSKIPPDVTQLDILRAQKYIQKTLEYTENRIGRFHGTLVAQFIKTSSNIFFNEFDVRPGDSEFINILESLESKLSDVITETLSESLTAPKMNNAQVVCIYHVPPGYPDKLDIFPFNLSEELINSENFFFGCVKKEGDSFITQKGRSFVVMGKNKDFSFARQEALSLSSSIRTGLFYREDIGLIEEKMLGEG